MTDIILIDLSSIVHPLWHICTNDPNPDATSIKSIERVRAIAADRRRCAVCIDSRTSFRKQLAPTYKAQRESNEPLQHQMRLAIETLKADGFPVWGADGFEADDVIASAAFVMRGYAIANDYNCRAVIFSADKDLMQLVSEDVAFHSLKSGDTLDPAAVKAKFGVLPDKMHDWLCLVGDSSDNVKGADKIGPKTATSLLDEFGSLENLWAAFDKGATPTMTPNLRTRLQDFRRDVWQTTSELIRLRTDVPVPFEEIFKPRVATGDDVAVFGGDDVTWAPTTFDNMTHAIVGGEVIDLKNKPTQAEIREVRKSLDVMFGESLNGTFAPPDAGFTAAGSVFTHAAAKADIDAAMPDTRVAQALPAATNGQSSVGGAAQQEQPRRPGESDPGDLPTSIQAAVERGRITAVKEQEQHAKREADTENRAPGQPVVRNDALRRKDGHRSDDPGASALPARESGTRDHGSDEQHSQQRSQPDTQVAIVSQRAAAPTTGVVVDYERQLEPRSLEQAYNLAKSMFQARLFSAYGNADAVLSTILAGRDFGMSASASVRAFHIVEGKPTLAADAIRGIILRSGAAEYFRCSERTAERATFVTKRKGEPEEQSLTYTIEQGRLAFGKDDVAWKKSGWGRNPDDMLVARAGAKLARLVYPDVIYGVYSPEEFD